MAGEPDNLGMGTGFDFNPAVSPYREDPYPFYRMARARPVGWSASLGAWLVARYTDVQTVLGAPDTFSAKAAYPLLYNNAPEVVAELRAGGVPEQRRLVDEDSSRHRHVRALLDVGLRGHRVRSLLPLLQRHADELIDAFSDGAAELVGEYASPYVQRVINTIIGFPPEDIDQIESWTNDGFAVDNPTLPVDAKIAAARRLGDYTRYLQALIEDRRTAPRDDLISILAHGANGIPPVADDHHIHGIVRGTRIAGFPTTRDAITATTLLALQHPAIHEGITHHATSTIIEASEEALRRNPPNRGVYRVTTRDTVLGGTRLPPGARLALLFDSANRDDTVFSHPDTPTLDRPNIHDHLSFGRGLHTCPGAPVARTEIRIALRTLFHRLPRLRLPANHTPTYRAHHLTRGLEHLHVHW